MENGMDGLQRLATEHNCTRLMHQFSWFVDAMDYDAVVGLFVADCTFSRADVSFHGHVGLRQSLESRPRDRTTRHIISNVLIDVRDTDYADGKSYCLVFGHRGPLSDEGEALLGAPDSLILYSGAFVRRPEGWRIAKWHIGLSFRKPAKAA
jgi:SnoaL-like domain